MALATTEGKLKAMIILSGSALLFLALTAGALAVTSTPTFCLSCHEMRPEYFTWQGSAHSQVSCVKCHIKPGAKNFVEHKVKSLKEVYLHFSGTYVTPIEMKEKMENSVCQQCHDIDKRVATPSGDIKFPHNRHLEKKVECVECHSGAVHGNIEEKGFTAMTDFEKWNSYVGAAYVSGKFTKLEMAKCLECHKERDVPVTCENCHFKILKPTGHRDAGWLTGHGREAEKDLSACNKCHSVTFIYGAIPSDFKAADYAKANSLCNGCHAKKPAGHSADWRKAHTKPAAESRELCMVCHSETRPRQDEKVPSKVYCHSITHNLNRSVHPYKIPPSGYGIECTRCHVVATCEACHIKTKT